MVCFVFKLLLVDIDLVGVGMGFYVCFDLIFKCIEFGLDSVGLCIGMCFE